MKVRRIAALVSGNLLGYGIAYTLVWGQWVAFGLFVATFVLVGVAYVAGGVL
jgi:hypothetical protein